jgi:acetylornithine deacetylase/succinyl-diaminopimelate desuccinylase-like protein
MNAQETTIAVLAAQLVASNKRADEAESSANRLNKVLSECQEYEARQASQICGHLADLRTKDELIVSLDKRAETAEKVRDCLKGKMDDAAKAMGLDVGLNAHTLNGNLINSCSITRKETDRLNQVFAQSGSLYNLVNDAADAMATLRGITGQDDSVCIQEVVKAIQAMCGPKVEIKIEANVDHAMTALRDLKAGEIVFMDQAASKCHQNPNPSAMDDDEHRGEAWRLFMESQGHAPVHDVSFDAGWKAGRACPWPMEK